MTLSDILARDVSLEWHEAVALVRGVVELLEKSSRRNCRSRVGSDRGFRCRTRQCQRRNECRRAGSPPGSAAAGDARIFRVAGSTSARRRAGHGACSRVRLDSRIRRGRGVFRTAGPRRCAPGSLCTSGGCAGPPDANHVATLDAIAPLPTTDRPKKSRKDAVKKSNPRRRQLMAGALLLLVCAGGVGYARIAGIAPQNRKVSAIAQKASDAVGAAMVSGLSAVTERAGLGRLVSTDAADDEPLPRSR